MKKTDTIFIAGHNGLVGRATLDLLKKKGFKNLITVNRKKLDLRDKIKVLRYFDGFMFYHVCVLFSRLLFFLFFF